MNEPFYRLAEHMESLRTITELLPATMAYAAMKLPIIPLHGKLPAVKGWQTFVADEATTLLWFGKRKRHIGLCTGESGYIVIDTDTEEADQWVNSHCTITAMQSRSGGGSLHRYYQNPVRKQVRNRQAVRGIAGLDVQGHGGFIVLPPSVHPETENRYEWLTDFLPPQQLPRFSPAWIYKRTRKRLTNETISADAGFMHLRARRWIEKRPGAVSGQGGHNHTYGTACKLVLYFGLDREKALELMRSWNTRCQPPWTDRELEHKVDDASKRRN